MEWIIGAGLIVLIIIGVIALIVKFISSIPYLNLIMMFVSALTLTISSFVMKLDDSRIFLIQGISIFAYFVFADADIAFNRYDEVETTGSYNDWTDTITVSSRVVSRSFFWGIIGSSLFIAVVAVVICDGLFETAKILGFIGLGFVIYWAIKFVIYIFKRIRTRNGNSYY